MRSVLAACIVCGAAALGSAAPVLADDPCAGFKWDVTREHALFSGAGIGLTGGLQGISAPALTADQLYTLQLAAQTSVVFVQAPGEKKPVDGAFAALVSLQVERSGRYRVSMDSAAWIDVVADGKLMPPADYQGQHSCDAPHKIVEFDLAGPKRYVVQISASARPALRLTVTQATPPKS